VAPEIRHITETSLQCLSTINRVFSDEDIILIKKFAFEGVHSKRLTDKFHEKSRTKRGVNKLLKKLGDTGTVDRRPVSSRPRSACTEENVKTVNDLVSSQEDKLQTHRTVREISRETGIHQSSVFRIICKNLCLKCFKRLRAQQLTNANCAASMKRAKLLLQNFPQSAADFVFFRDKKMFSVIGRRPVHSKCNLFAFSSICAEYLHKI